MRFHKHLVYSFLPDSVEIQRNSFSTLLKKGFIKELAIRNPISNLTHDLELFFYPQYYQLNRPEYTPTEAILKSKSYSCKLYVPVQLTNRQSNEIKLQWVLLGNLPLMTKRGHFIVNGSPRVVINQLVRSPGIYYQEAIDIKKRKTYYADLISYRGTWLRLEIDKKRRVWARMKKIPKISALVFLQALGFTRNQMKFGIRFFDFLNGSRLKENHPYTTEEALISLYEESQKKPSKKLAGPSKEDKPQVGDITPLMGQKFLFRKFMNPRTYNLSLVGRMRLNKKFGINEKDLTLTRLDIFCAINYLISLKFGITSVDDIDNLKNRRVKASGELIQNQLNTGLIRLEKTIRDKMNKVKKGLTIQNLITTKPINGALREFFGSSPLSQYLDQTNPLAEITHKRRLSSLGPGGLSRETAGMAVRSIHPTHYGRICPIETPEGRNAGLVNSMTIHAKINSHGFLKTPFYNVYQGQIQKQDSSLRDGRPIYFSAEQEDVVKVAPGDLKSSLLNFLSISKIPIRIEKDYYRVPREQVEYIAMSPIQMISIATSLIPFLEHDDANRALMGSNMQRQAVPIMLPERPIVGTGLEARAAADSGYVVQSKMGGCVSYASGKKIVILEKSNAYPLSAGNTKAWVRSASKPKQDLMPVSFDARALPMVKLSRKGPKGYKAHKNLLSGKKKILMLDAPSCFAWQRGEEPFYPSTLLKKGSARIWLPFKKRNLKIRARETKIEDFNETKIEDFNETKIENFNKPFFKEQHAPCSTCLLKPVRLLVLSKILTSRVLKARDTSFYGFYVVEPTHPNKHLTKTRNKKNTVDSLPSSKVSKPFFRYKNVETKKSFQNKFTVRRIPCKEYKEYEYRQKVKISNNVDSREFYMNLKCSKENSLINLLFVFLIQSTESFPNFLTMLLKPSVLTSKYYKAHTALAASFPCFPLKTQSIRSLRSLYKTNISIFSTSLPKPIRIQDYINKLYLLITYDIGADKSKTYNKKIKDNLKLQLQTRLSFSLSSKKGKQIDTEVKQESSKNRLFWAVISERNLGQTSNKNEETLKSVQGKQKSKILTKQKKGSLKSPKVPINARILRSRILTSLFFKSNTRLLAAHTLLKSNMLNLLSIRPADREAQKAICAPWLPIGEIPSEIEVGKDINENHNQKIKSNEYSLQNYQRSNQETCLAQRPTVLEGEWVQQGDLLADCTSSVSGDLSLGKNILVAYMPWEGYNFEDAILISERLVYDDIYTSLHIQRYEVEIRDTKFGVEQISYQTPDTPFWENLHLDEKGIAKVGSWVKEGDILVGKVTPIKKKSLSPHEKLLYDIVGKKIPTTRNTSLRLPKGVEGRVINVEILETENIPPGISFAGPGRVHVFLAEKRKIQVGDKISGRHGNKGIVSKIIPQQDMPYLPNGTPVDMVLNPLGVPSRMNVGQVFEALLGLAGLHLNQSFKIPSFDETYGPEASRSIIYSKLYEARLKSGQKWLFDPNFPGKTRVFDGRTGQCFDQLVTVGRAYMLKLVHQVDDKIHARSTGPYSLVTQQPLRGRAKHGGQRLGEMEVWALEGFGAAYTLQELLTIKSDDIKGRHKVISSIFNNTPITTGTPEAFKVLIGELQSLCLDPVIYVKTEDSTKAATRINNVMNLGVIRKRKTRVIRRIRRKKVGGSVV